MEMHIPEWMSRRRHAGGNATVGALALAAFAACSSGGGNHGGNTDPGPGDLAVQPLPPDLLGLDLKDSTYPPGPYAQAGGVNQGDVLPDFTFQGYWSPNTTTGKASSQTFGEVTFGMLHASGARYAIVNLSAFW
jgi:hypothetical protein